MIYVVGAPQLLHFEMLFDLAESAGWLPQSVEVRHLAFGSVLGENGKPFKTRSGTTVKLSTLLDAAVEKAQLLLTEKGSTAPAGEEQLLAHAIGIGAVKYADLSNDLAKDYVFSLERMVALEGNTAPYLQYAHARLCSLLDRADSVGELTVLATLADSRLAKVLLGFPGAVSAAAGELAPHLLCGQLFELAQALSTFYAACPVLGATGEVRSSRLALCRIAADALGSGLGLLGIQAPRRM